MAEERGEISPRLEGVDHKISEIHNLHCAQMQERNKVCQLEYVVLVRDHLLYSIRRRWSD